MTETKQNTEELEELQDQNKEETPTTDPVEDPVQDENRNDQEDNPTSETEVQEERSTNDENQPEDEERSTEDEPVTDTEQPTEEPKEKENIVDGMAIVFNSLSEDLGGYFEIIEPTAIDEELLQNSDIKYLYQHDDNTVPPLARYCPKKGIDTLKLELRSDGLRYSFPCKNKLIYDAISARSIDEASFAFTLPADGSGERWEKTEQGYIRHITKISGLHDLSAVTNAAYKSAYTHARSLTTEPVEDSYYTEYETIIRNLSK